MTSPTSGRIDLPRGRQGRGGDGGFTLVEMLCVLGIILVLVALLVPTVNSIYGKANRAAARADLDAIGVALEAYKQDFGDYPRVVVDRGVEPTLTMDTGMFSPLDTRPNPPSGAQVLCAALYAPLQAVEQMPPMGKRVAQDGHDGLGFRTRPGGKVYPPYLPPERFEIGVDDETNNRNFQNDLRMTIIDRFNRQVLYFPASPAKPNVRMVSTMWPYIGVPRRMGHEHSYYDCNDNLRAFTAAVVAGNISNDQGVRKISLMLGDLDVNGYINGNETPVELPFLLWSVGPDEKWGPFADMAEPRGNPITEPLTLDARDAAICDDVTNFRDK